MNMTLMNYYLGFDLDREWAMVVPIHWLHLQVQFVWEDLLSRKQEAGTKMHSSKAKSLHIYFQ
jgi:hypothetical protein